MLQMTDLLRLFAFIVALFSGASAMADGIKVVDSYVISNGPAAPTGAAYMVIRNDGDTDDRLLSVRSDAAARIMVHVTTQTDTGVMQMRAADDGLLLPSHGQLLLAPGGTHVMLMGLTAPLVVGETVPVTLVFEVAGDVPVDLVVIAR